MLFEIFLTLILADYCRLQKDYMRSQTQRYNIKIVGITGRVTLNLIIR